MINKGKRLLDLFSFTKRILCISAYSSLWKFVNCRREVIIRTKLITVYDAVRHFNFDWDCDLRAAHNRGSQLSQLTRSLELFIAILYHFDLQIDYENLALKRKITIGIRNQ